MTSQIANPVPDEHKGHSIQTPIDGLIRAIATRFGGNKAKEVERFIKFCIVGTIGFVVDFGTTNILQSTILPPVDSNGVDLPTNVSIAITISFIAAITSNFIWNRLWTYPDSRSSSVRRQLIQFTLVSISGWVARTLWVTLAYQPIGDMLYPVIGDLSIFANMSPELAAAKIGTNVTLFVGVFTVMIWNFFANRYWTYNDVD